MNKSFFGTVVAMLLVAAIIIAVGVGSSWFTNWDVKTWFDNWGQNVEELPKDSEQETGALRCTVVPVCEIWIDSAPLAYTAESGIEEYASDGVNLHVTIAPANATNKKVDVTAAWQNSASEWATGKNVNDYISIVQETDGALDIAIAAKQAFGEQIKLTVSSRENSEITAEVICDYVKKAERVNLNLNDGKISFNGTLYTLDTTFSAAYTLDSEFSVSKIEIELTDGFWNALKAQVSGYYEGLDYYTYGKGMYTKPLIAKDGKLTFYDGSKTFNFVDCFIHFNTDADDHGMEWETAITAELLRAYNDTVATYTDAHATISLYYESKYNTSEVKQGVYKLDVQLDDTIPVNDIEASDTNLYL